MIAFLSLVLIGTMALSAPPPTDRPTSRVAAITALLDAPDRRVRTTDARIQRLMIQGVRRSFTFASLVKAVNDTDVIVYIQPTSDLPRSLDGRLLLVPLTTHQRYLRIQIHPGSSSEETIAVIGHELQHALEIAGDPEARTQAGVVALYKRIGLVNLGVHTYDTVAAQQTGRQVRSELVG
jgi:hypothetical protein